MAPPLVTLTSDFGLRDYYVGAMKGVVLSLAPSARIVDISHDIGAQDILEGAFVLHYAAREFPPGTIHCAIVDPGVGSARRALAFASQEQLWVGPDNGLLSFALQDATGPIYAIDSARVGSGRQSATFHGRDLFAPAAAQLANGWSLSDLGNPIADPVYLDAATRQVEADGIDGHIIHVDRFGNLVSNIARTDIAPFAHAPCIRIGRAQPLHELKKTYTDVAPGQLVALIGSAELVEISVNGGSAARQLGVERGTSIRVEAQHTA